MRTKTVYQDKQQRHKDLTTQFFDAPDIPDRL